MQTHMIIRTMVLALWSVVLCAHMWVGCNLGSIRAEQLVFSLYTHIASSVSLTYDPVVVTLRGSVAFILKWRRKDQRVNLKHIIALALRLVSYKWVEWLIIWLFWTLNQPLNQHLNLPLNLLLNPLLTIGGLAENGWKYIEKLCFLSYLRKAKTQLTISQIKEDGSVCAQASRGQSEWFFRTFCGRILHWETENHQCCSSSTILWV